MEDLQQTSKLSYTIHSYSSVADNFNPENIMVNNPLDLKSRWLVDSEKEGPHYIVLKLTKTAIVKSITFGKHIKSQATDLKKFSIYGGLFEDNLSHVLTDRLKNDNRMETFKLPYTKEKTFRPLNFVKIEVKESYDNTQNCSIWYVELHGNAQNEVMERVMSFECLDKEYQSVRIILKHLRQAKYFESYKSLVAETGVSLEGEWNTKLWEALVENGDYAKAEELVHEAAECGEFDEYLRRFGFQARWRQLSPCSESVVSRLNVAEPPPYSAVTHDLPCTDRDCLPDRPLENGDVGSSMDTDLLIERRPGPRGGHQLVVDTTTSNLYLYGGWNGTKDLDDLWAYDVKAERWKELCPHSGAVGGPSPRSCHKMVFDPVDKRLYIVGRYLETAQRTPPNMKCEMHTYDVTTQKWSIICEDTKAVGGPSLVFDHQMCIDVERRVIYMFGGRILPLNSDESLTPHYSGLYSYHIATGEWRELPCGDMLPRVGHSMLYHPKERRLYVFAGQRNKEQLVELWWYDVSDDHSDPKGREVKAQAIKWSAGVAAPRPGFTQRATIDPETNEMFVLSGMSKVCFSTPVVRNAMWAVPLDGGKSTLIFSSDDPPEQYPQPRFAHQLVYDANTKLHYLFGGNPGHHLIPRLRLDDLWCLEMVRKSPQKLAKEICAKIREHCYKEMANNALYDPTLAPKALKYLRKDVFETINHSDTKKVGEFHKMPECLFGGNLNTTPFLCTRLDPEWCDHFEKLKKTLQSAEMTSTADRFAEILGATIDDKQSMDESKNRGENKWDMNLLESRPRPREWIIRAHRESLHEMIVNHCDPSSILTDSVFSLVDN